MSCPFCIIDKQRTEVLGKWKHVMAVLSNPRLAQGHILIIPKRHVEQITELESAELKELMHVVSLHHEKILSFMQGEGCDIRIHYRPFLPQSDVKVDHLHVHLIPRNLKDELWEKSMQFETGIFAPLRPDERTHYAELFKK